MIALFAEENGLGHIMRLIPLALALEKEGEEVLFLSSKRGCEIAQSYGLRTEIWPLKLPMNQIDAGFNMYGLVNDYLKTFSLASFQKIAKSLREEGVNVAISDSSVFALFVTQWAKIEHTFFLSSHTDQTALLYNILLKTGLGVTNSFISKSVEEMLIIDFPPPYSISLLDDEVMFPNVRFMGPIKTLVARDCMSCSSVKPYVFLSNAPDIDHTARLLDEAGVWYKRVEKERSCSHEEYVKLFAEASLIIGHGGHGTIVDCLATRKPQIIIYNEKYRERRNNALHCKQLGISVSLSSGQLTNPMVLRGAIEEAFTKLDKIDFFSEMVKKCDGIENIIYHSKLADYLRR